MLKSADTGLRAVPFPMDDPERVPVQRYFDEEFYQMELDHLWPHVWQNACRLEQIPEPGDWIEYANVGKSVIVVNAGENGIKAFHNACRHRGVPFAGGTTTDCSHSTANGNCSRTGFVCPFHGWRWNMNGENTRVYGGAHLFSEHNLDPKDINLVECRTDTWAGCVWINHDDDAPPLREYLGPVADRFDAHGVADLRAEWCYGTVLPANWKIAMEAFMEGYHVMQTHPQLHAESTGMYANMYETPRDGAGQDEIARSRTAADSVDVKEAIASQIRSMQLLSEGMAGMVHQKEVDILHTVSTEGLPDDAAQAVPMWFGRAMAKITEDLRARGEPTPDLLSVAQSDPIHAVEFFFPHYFLLPTFSSMSGYRIRPLGPEKCFFEIWSFTMYPEGEAPEAVMEPTVLPYDSPDFPPIPRQDYANIPIQQMGLHAKGFEYMRLSNTVEGMISNYQRIVDGYLAGVAQEKLTKAINELGGNFDGIIKDLDL